MDIYNDTTILEEKKNLLKKSKISFGDVNLQMINMINVARSNLEGKQMKLAEKTTLQSVKQVKNIITNIDGMISFTDKLQEALEIYLSSKFREV